MNIFIEININKNIIKGAISPQLQFCTSTVIEETRTPSFDILKEHEQRFLYDPLIDIKVSLFCLWRLLSLSKKFIV